MASGPVRITDPADSRVDDYRSLHDARIRRRMEEGGDGDPGFFVAEGGHAVERLLASGRRLRSVLLDPIRLEALGPALDGVDVLFRLVVCPDLDVVQLREVRCEQRADRATTDDTHPHVYEASLALTRR